MTLSMLYIRRALCNFELNRVFSYPAICSKSAAEFLLWVVVVPIRPGAVHAGCFIRPVEVLGLDEPQRPLEIAGLNRPDKGVSTTAAVGAASAGVIRPPASAEVTAFIVAAMGSALDRRQSELDSTFAAGRQGGRAR